MGDCTYRWLIDTGYSRRIGDKFSFGGEFSFGSAVQFVNYPDNRFSDGGYSLRENKDGIFGVGVNASYFILAKLEVLTGYNSSKGILFEVIYTIF